MALTMLRGDLLDHIRLPKRPTGRRDDIQGLRALAVLAVVVDHLFGWPGGGFVGVDVFFVISGFLITGLLVREWERTDRISWTHFYTRRVKRIIPASLVVLAVTVAAARLLYSAERAHSVVLDALWSLFFAGNWRFLLTGTDYFQQAADPSPLQHFWSLGVEEQFYFVWPWLMLGILLILLKLDIPDRIDRPIIAGVMGVIVLASFVYAMGASAANPTSAYFSTFTRVWELGIGALLASLTPFLARWTSSFWRTVAAWGGVFGILVSYFVISANVQFPAPWSALPVLATALVIAAGTSGPQPRIWPLTNRFCTYVGDISYSLYLWHFPTIILIGGLFAQRSGWAYYALLIIVMSFLSIASFHAIEEPLIHSPLWNGTKSKRARRLEYRQWRRTYARTASTFGLIGLIGVAGGTAWLAREATKPSSTPAIAAVVPLPTDSGGAANPVSESAMVIQKELAQSLAATDWPQLPVPTGDPETLTACRKVDPADPASCAFGDPSRPELVIMGDSLAGALLATVRAAYGDEYFIRSLTKPACPANGYELKFGSYDKGACQQFVRAALDFVAKTKPRAVFLINNYAWTQAAYTPVGQDAATNAARWGAGTQKLVRELLSRGTKVVIVGAQSEGRDLKDCRTPRSAPADCISTVRGYWQPIHDAEQKIKDATFVDTQHWWCVQGHCPAFAAGVPVRTDQIHPTLAWAQHVAKDFRAMVDASKVLVN